MHGQAATTFSRPTTDLYRVKVTVGHFRFSFSISAPFHLPAKQFQAASVTLHLHLARFSAAVVPPFKAISQVPGNSAGAGLGVCPLPTSGLHGDRQIHLFINS